MKRTFRIWALIDMSTDMTTDMSTDHRTVSHQSKTLLLLFIVDMSLTLFTFLLIINFPKKKVNEVVLLEPYCCTITGSDWSEPYTFKIKTALSVLTLKINQMKPSTFMCLVSHCKLVSLKCSSCYLTSVTSVVILTCGPFVHVLFSLVDSLVRWVLILSLVHCLNYA